MTSSSTIAPLRWQDPPAQISVPDSASARAYYQITTSRPLTEMCLGRPAEELPRILTILGPAHHLCAAAAVDQLMGVTPPPLALNMREALRRALFLSAHLRRLYFLLTAFVAPLTPASLASTADRPLHNMLARLMRHVALAQEAETILGGRADHPVTSLAGGVSRYLKEDHYPRLAEIAAALVGFTEELADWRRRHLGTDGSKLADYTDIQIPPLPGLMAALPVPDATDTDAGDTHVDMPPAELLLTDAGGAALRRFAVKQLWDQIDLVTEPWSHQPFAFQRNSGWQGLNGATDHLFYTGPLARLNGGAPLEAMAAAERDRLVETLGAFPHYSVAAAAWALVIEAQQAAECLGPLCQPEKLLGPFTRDYPQTLGDTGGAALEAPGGLIALHFQADRQGRVTAIRILDTATANNALRNLVAQKVWQLSDSQDLTRLRRRFEVSLLLF